VRRRTGQRRRHSKLHRVQFQLALAVHPVLPSARIRGALEVNPAIAGNVEGAKSRLDLALSPRRGCYFDRTIDPVLGKESITAIGKAMKRRADAGDRTAAVQVHTVMFHLELDEGEL